MWTLQNTPSILWRGPCHVPNTCTVGHPMWSRAPPCALHMLILMCPHMLNKTYQVQVHPPHKVLCKGTLSTPHARQKITKWLCTLPTKPLARGHLAPKSLRRGLPTLSRGGHPHVGSPHISSWLGHCQLARNLQGAHPASTLGPSRDFGLAAGVRGSSRAPLEGRVA